MRNGLFDDFQPQSAESWTEQLIKDLRGEPIDSLLWKTHGVSGKPFYTSEDLDFELFNYSNFNENSALFGDRFWVNYQPVKVEDFKEANRTILNALQHGASGILLQIDEIPDFGKLLAEVQPEYCHLSFQLHQAVPADAFIQQYESYLESLEIDKHKVSGFISGANSYSTKIPNIRSIEIRTDSHGHLALEIALAIAGMIDRLDQLTNSGKDIQEALNQVFFRVSVSKDFFLQIAVHRAIRRLFSTISSAYGVESAQAEIISEVGPWTAEIDDPHSFMLHATTQAMSAIMGGTDGLIVYPFYNVFPSKQSLAERIARNISSILSEESYLNKMVDPAAGSYYIEELTNTLFNDTMVLLQKIEEAGGLSKIDVEQFKNQAQ